MDKCKNLWPCDFIVILLEGIGHISWMSRKTGLQCGLERESACGTWRRKMLWVQQKRNCYIGQNPVCSNPWQQWCKRAATGIAASAQTSCKFSKSQNLGCNVYLTCFWDWNTDAHLRACFIALQKICSNRLQRNSRILTCLFGAILAKPTLFWVAQSSFLWKWPTTPQANLQTATSCNLPELKAFRLTWTVKQTFSVGDFPSKRRLQYAASWTTAPQCCCMAHFVISFMQLLALNKGAQCALPRAFESRVQHEKRRVLPQWFLKTWETWRK